MRAEGAREEAWKEEARGEKKEEAREREKKKERDGGTLACKQRGYAAPLLSSPLLTSPLHSSPPLSSDRPVRLTRSLARSLALLRPFRDGALGPSPSLPLYPVRCFPLFPFPRVHVRACTRVACASSSIGGRVTQRAGYFSGWDI